MAWKNGGDWNPTKGFFVSESPDTPAWYTRNSTPEFYVKDLASEIVKAINERETILGMPESKLWGYSTMGSNPEPSEFVGMYFIHYPDFIGRTMQSFWDAVHAHIQLMVDTTGPFVPDEKYIKDSADIKMLYVNWAKSATDETVYTDISDLLLATATAPNGGEWISSTNHTDARLYIQIKEALDLLQWPVVYYYIREDDLNDVSLKGATHSWAAPDRWENSWDDAIAATPVPGTPVGWTPFGVMVAQGGAGGGAAAQISDEITFSGPYTTDILNLTSSVVLKSYINAFGAHHHLLTEDALDLNTQLEAEILIPGSTLTMTLPTGSPDRFVTGEVSAAVSGGNRWPVPGGAANAKKVSFVSVPADSPFQEGTPYPTTPIPEVVSVHLGYSFHSRVIADGLEIHDVAGFPNIRRYLTGFGYGGWDDDSCRMYLDIGPDLTFK